MILWVGLLLVHCCLCLTGAGGESPGLETCMRCSQVKESTRLKSHDQLILLCSILTSDISHCCWWTCVIILLNMPIWLFLVSENNRNIQMFIMSSVLLKLWSLLGLWSNLNLICDDQRLFSSHRMKTHDSQLMTLWFTYWETVLQSYILQSLFCWAFVKGGSDTCFGKYI